ALKRPGVNPASLSYMLLSLRRFRSDTIEIPESARLVDLNLTEATQTRDHVPERSIFVLIQELERHRHGKLEDIQRATISNRPSTATNANGCSRCKLGDFHDGERSAARNASNLTTNPVKVADAAVKRVRERASQ